MFFDGEVYMTEMCDAALAGIKAIIGLGNPGIGYYKTRHSIGFRVVDKLAQRYHGQWRAHDNMEIADIVINNMPVMLIKPMRFMNSSGVVIPYLQKKGIKPENILVIHDELEKSFGQVSIKTGGSARGHNGLRSIIAQCGPDFMRVRVGIGRPENKDMVAEYVLKPFDRDKQEVEDMIDAAVDLVEAGFGANNID